jgi:hypothetical protein
MKVTRRPLSTGIVIAAVVSAIKVIEIDWHRYVRYYQLKRKKDLK